MKHFYARYIENLQVNNEKTNYPIKMQTNKQTNF